MPEAQPPADPMALLYAAAEHIRQGVPEIELEWWHDGDCNDSRLTITMRRSDRNTALGRSADAAAGRPTSYEVVDADGRPLGTMQVPDTPEGLEDN